MVIEGFTRLELQERLSKQRVTRKQDYKNPPQTVGNGRVPPARPTAPGRKTCRPGSLRIINHLGGNSGEVEKAKEEYEADKFEKSAVESVRSRLSWWRKRAREHKISPLPSDRGAFAAPGNSVETSWL